MNNIKVHDRIANALRIGGAIAGTVLLVWQYARITRFGSAAIYTATWITFLHVCIGDYALVRYLHARSALQNVLDLLASLFLLAAMLAFTSPALWCAFMGGLFAIAVTKYLLIAHGTDDRALKQYATEKVHWESPSVVGFAVLALVLDQLPPTSTMAHAIQLAILIAATGFAIWMIAIRHAYRRVAQNSKATGVAGHPGA